MIFSSLESSRKKIISREDFAKLSKSQLQNIKRVKCVPASLDDDDDWGSVEIQLKVPELRKINFFDSDL